MRFKGKKPIASVKDTWSLDYILDPIIHTLLVKFKEVVQSEDNCAGFPSAVLSDINDLTCEERDEYGLRTWHEILDKMIYAFGDNEPELEDGMIEMITTPSEEDPALHNITFNTSPEYDIYTKDIDEHHKKVKEGRELFIEYYDNLGW